MCGIAGFSFTTDTCINAREVARALFGEIVSRGREAAGYAYLERGELVDQIDGMNFAGSADLFVKNRKFRLPAEARTAILHTRLATKGKVSNSLNNHPTYAWADGGACIAAVHNGCISNDDEKFEEYALPRFGEVDSEIIPALLAQLGSHKFYRVFNELDGWIATAWLDERTPGVMHAVRGWDSPMMIVKIDTITPSGAINGVMFASTMAALSKGLGAMGLTWSSDGVRHFEIGEGEYFSVLHGEWDGLVYPIELPEPYSSFYTSRNSKGWKGWKTGQGTGWGSSSAHGWTDEDMGAAARAAEANLGPFKSGIGSGRVDSGKPSLSCSSNSVIPCGDLMLCYNCQTMAGCTQEGCYAGRIGEKMCDVCVLFLHQGRAIVLEGVDEFTAAIKNESKVNDALSEIDRGDGPSAVAALMAGPRPREADDSQEYARWWESQTFYSDVADLAERFIVDERYEPTVREVRMVASLTEDQALALSLHSVWLAFREDYMVHMEVCARGCCWNDPQCPGNMADTSPSAVEKAAKRWGIAALHGGTKELVGV